MKDRPATALPPAWRDAARPLVGAWLVGGLGLGNLVAWSLMTTPAWRWSTGLALLLLVGGEGWQRRQAAAAADPGWSVRAAAAVAGAWLGWLLYEAQAPNVHANRWDFALLAALGLMWSWAEGWGRVPERRTIAAPAWIDEAQAQLPWVAVAIAVAASTAAGLWGAARGPDDALRAGAGAILLVATIILWRSRPILDHRSWPTRLRWQAAGLLGGTLLFRAQYEALYADGLDGALWLVQVALAVAMLPLAPPDPQHAPRTGSPATAQDTPHDADA